MTWEPKRLIGPLSSQYEDRRADWATNEAGFSHSHQHGFGLLSAWRLVNAAKVSGVGRAGRPLAWPGRAACPPLPGVLSALLPAMPTVQVRKRLSASSFQPFVGSKRGLDTPWSPGCSGSPFTLVQPFPLAPPVVPWGPQGVSRQGSRNERG